MTLARSTRRKGDRLDANLPLDLQPDPALLSRLRHQCHTVKIEGPSLRGGDGDATA